MSKCKHEWIQENHSARFNCRKCSASEIGVLMWPTAKSDLEKAEADRDKYKHILHSFLVDTIRDANEICKEYLDMDFIQEEASEDE